MSNASHPGHARLDRRNLGRVARPLAALGFVAGVAVLVIAIRRRDPQTRWAFVLALAAILGALRFNLAQPRFDQTTLATYNDQPQPVTVEGVAAAEPDARDAYTNLRVKADQLIISDPASGVTRTVRGLVLVQAPPFSDYGYGDRLKVEGKLQMPADYLHPAYPNPASRALRIASARSLT